ncbi:hotdog domain-containing protein [Streptomyces sp. MI02-2A]|uniref:acyl-CoA thioesterase n=1 Tax=unclassified Streptomyces TaxID=2593676 RepID=UPI000B0D6B34|nr:MULTISPECIES: hotdog domain-containing protein [unclassified Streptomyces]MDX3265542.1 hotdog domain-containing protein [Streptomyces sp. MI02-2A]REE65663.1 acyl-CoA thioester hydrolase [Streptomyces sp. 3212.3]
MTTLPQYRNPVGVHRTRIEWIDTDAAGIYHNSVIVRFVEAAEASLMGGLGLHGYFPVAPRVHYEVDFESPLFFGQDVCTVVELVRIGTTSMAFDFEVWGQEFRERPCRRAASGRYVTAHSNRDHLNGAASIPWPEEWIAALSRPERSRQLRPPCCPG